MGLIRRLAELGFTKGARVRVLHSSPPGPVLVMVKGSRIALGRGVAMRVMISLQEVI
ncbi:FeoA family protein [Thermofilum pendens]|nr:FeoA family protein [Thermofilum pendens]